MLSMTSDYLADTGCPEPYLRRIAEAGFSHVHWCHHWSTDFLYSRWEIEQIAAWLEACALALTARDRSVSTRTSSGAAPSATHICRVTSPHVNDR